MKKSALILIFCLIAPFAALCWGEQPETIRVALLKEVESVGLEGVGLLAVDERGDPIRNSSGFYVMRAKDRSGLVVNGRSLGRLTVTASAYIRVNGRKHRGEIEIYPIDKGLLVVNELPLEDYLVGLINCEISSQWPMDAVKAQAVVARSYAVYQKEARKNLPYDLESTVIDQVYNGCEIEDSRAQRGVTETAGEVLTFNGGVIQAFYHSNCGGHTESSENVWGYPIPYLQGVDCSYCLAAQSAKWELRLPIYRIESLLRNGGYQVSGLRDIRTGQRNRSGRVTDLLLICSNGNQTISAVNFRKAVGYTLIKSTNFEVRIMGGDAIFNGNGYGHGVGLCQWGAKHRAAEGFDYREILAYYYPGARLKKQYGR